MKSVTIHNLDSDLAQAIEKIAASTGLSQNKTVKLLLRKALGLDPRRTSDSDFSEFCGVWSSQEGQQFNQSLQFFERIDEELWQ